MRLIDLQPRWIIPSQWVPLDPFYVGLSFLCPHCAKTQCSSCGAYKTGFRLAVNFWPPIDPAGWMGRVAIPFPDNNGHRRSGETFDTLTLTPSVGFEGIGHWHGNITLGETTP
jgi:hypothetical protein